MNSSSKVFAPSAFGTVERFILISILIAGVFIRFIMLDQRPVHHDESLHMMYGRYFYDWPDIQYYKYDPMLHGPFLYNTLRAVYSTLGSTTEAGRTLTALLGSLLIFLPLLFRKWLSNAACIGLIAALAFSPTLSYYSRFIREDIPVLFALAILLYGCTAAPARWRWSLGFISFSLQMTMKENVFVTAAILAGYLAFEEAYYFFFEKKEDTLVRRALRNLKSYWSEAIIGLVVAVAIYVWFFSAGLRHPVGISAFFTESFSYWFNQHKVERIKGPFNFHLYVLSWYELPFIIATIVGASIFLKTTTPLLRGLAFATFFIAAGFGVAWAGESPEGYKVWDFFKLKDALDIIGVLILIPYAVILTIHHLQRGEKNLALWSYLFTASLFSYSYLGEKVPWLCLYPFIPGLIYLSILFDSYWRANPIKDWTTYPTTKVINLFAISFGLLALWFIIEESTSVVTNAGFWLLVVTLVFALLANTPRVRSLLRALMNRINSHSSFDTGNIVGWSSIALSVAIFCTLNWGLDPRSNPQRHNLFMLGVAIFAIGLCNLSAVKGLLGRVNLRNVIFVIFCIYTIRAMTLTNFIYGGHAREYLSQVHTTPQFDAVLKSIRADMESGVLGFKPKMYCNGDATWPVTWYMVGLPGEYKFNVPPEERATFKYQIIDDPIKPGEVTDGYKKLVVPLRGWWVPDFKKMTLKKFLNYSLNHTNWSDSGFTNVTLMVKE